MPRWQARPNAKAAQQAAEESRGRAEEQRRRAVAAAEEALSKERSAYAPLNLDANPELSLILAREALRSSDTLAARTALRQALARRLVQRTYKASGPVRGVVIDSATGVITAAASDGTVDGWDASRAAHLRWRAHDLHRNHAFERSSLLTE